MRFVYVILFLLFNANGKQEADMPPVEEKSYDKGFVMQAVTTGIQGFVIDFKPAVLPGTALNPEIYLFTESFPSRSCTLNTHGFIPGKLKKRMHFRGHPDDPELA